MSCQPPCASQICFWPFVQRVAPGTHDPPHTPPAQRTGTACRSATRRRGCTSAARCSRTGARRACTIRRTARRCRRTGTACRTATRPPTCRSAGRCRCTRPARACTRPSRRPGCRRTGTPGSLSHAPSALHDWGTPDELHWRAPGMQTPVQSPCRQTYVQAGVDCQSPWASHTCGMLPTHIFAPGVQTPTQLPAAQMLPQVVPRCHAPLASQVRGVLTSQRRSPGMQSFASRPPARPSRRRPSGSTHQGCWSRRSPGLRSRRGHLPRRTQVTPRPPAAVPAAPADPEVPAVPAVPDAPASAPPVPAASLLSTALIDPHAAAQITGSSQATRVSSASRFVITKPTVEDRQPFIVRAGADLNAQIARMDGAVGLGSQVPDPVPRQLPGRASASRARVSDPGARQLPGRASATRAIAGTGDCLERDRQPTRPVHPPSHRRRRLPRSPPGPRCPSSRHARPRPPPRSAAPEPAISEPASRRRSTHPRRAYRRRCYLLRETTVSHFHSTWIRIPERRCSRRMSRVRRLVGTLF